jgi:hypothetical protein
MAPLDHTTLLVEKGKEFVIATMGNGDKPFSGGGNGLRPTAEEQPFDKWLRKQLHAIYDDVVQEPLPAELVKLIDDDAALVRQRDASRPVDDSSDKS